MVKNLDELLKQCRHKDDDDWCTLSTNLHCSRVICPILKGKAIKPTKRETINAIMEQIKSILSDQIGYVDMMHKYFLITTKDNLQGYTVPYLEEILRSLQSKARFPFEMTKHLSFRSV